MKQALLFVMSLIIFVVSGCCTAKLGCTDKNISSEEKLKNMETVYQFLKEAKVYYIATVEGDQPRVRPFGTVNIFEGKLYIQTGRVKNVAKQLLVNGKTEICAMKGQDWIRITGTLVDDTRLEPQIAMLNKYPNLKAMYKPGDGNCMVLYFKNATARIYSFQRGINSPVVMQF